MKQSSMTCMSYLQKLRLDLGKILLTKTELPVSEISMRVGYPDPNYFTKLFKKTEGMTPTRFRKS
jgi:YesN/AraC family two-component response regulator